MPPASPAPERRASVSTPDSEAFRAAWDTARSPGEPDRTRGNGASPAETAPSAVDRPREPRSSADRTDDRSAGHDPTAADAETSTTAKDSSATETATDAEPDESSTGEGEQAVGGASENTADDSGEDVAAIGIAAVTSVSTDAAPVSIEAGPAAAAGIDGSRDVESSDPRSAPQPTIPASTRPGDESTDTRPAVDAARPLIDTESVATTGTPATNGSAAPEPESATTPAAVASSVPGGSAGQASAATPSTGTPIPDGFQPVTPAPAEPVATTAASGAASAASDIARPRPNAGPRASTSSRETPAAVARAVQVNQSIEAARAGEAAPNTEGVTPAAVNPVAAAEAPSVATRLAAQSLPTASANAALSTPDDSAAPTMPGVARGLDALANQKGGSLVMRLDPPSLGQLRLEMRMEGGRVSVLMTAASESARALLRDNLGSLRTALEDRGLAVDRLAVETAGRNTESSNARSDGRSDGRGDGQDARGGQDASGRQDAGDGRSRGRRDDASGRQPGRGDGPGRQEAAEFSEVLAGAGASDH